MPLSREDRITLAGLIGFLSIAAGVAYYGMQQLSTVEASGVRLDPSQAVQGRLIYGKHCASCHGDDLQGAPNWRIRLPNGRMPAPPHDDTGHTWHHPDEVLFGITKYGLVPPYAPKDYPSDMPAFGSVLSDDEIRAVLAYIESRWSPETTRMRNEILTRRGAADRSFANR